MGVLMIASFIVLGFSNNVYEDKAITRIVLKTEPAKQEEEVGENENENEEDLFYDPEISALQELKEYFGDQPGQPTTPEKKKPPTIPSSAPRELKTHVV